MAEIDQAKADEVIRDLYGRLSEGADFIEAIGSVSTALNCHMIGLHFEDNVSSESVMRVGGSASLRDISDLMSDYERNWKGKNEWLHRGMRLMAKQGFSDGDDCITESELLRIPYFANFCAPLGIRHGVGFLLQAESGSGAAVLSLNRSGFNGYFSESERRFFPMLLPHVRSAFRVARTAELLGSRIDDLTQVLDYVGVGIALVDSKLEVVSINQAALAAITSIGLGLRPGVGSQINLGSRRVNDWIRASVARSIGNGQPSGPILLGFGRSNEPRYSVEIVPFRKREARNESRVCAVFRKVDLSVPSSTDQKTLEATFSFTESEAAVVSQLVCLGTPELVADRLGVSLSTVRSHIQHAFSKAGVRKQTDLVVIAERVLRGGFQRE